MRAIPPRVSNHGVFGFIGFVVVLGVWESSHTPKTMEIPRDPCVSFGGGFTGMV